MTHFEKLEHDLKFNVYKDPIHGKIAKENFQYGVAQERLRVTHIFKQWLEDNSSITLPEENRTMLNDLLRKIEE